MFAAARSFSASPSADWTCGFEVSSPRGVFTGSDASNGTLYGDGAASSARSQKRRKSSAPRESRFSCRSHAASTSHARPTATGPDDAAAAAPTGAGARRAGPAAEAPAHRHEVVARELAAVLTVAEHHPLHVGSR